MQLLYLGSAPAAAALLVILGIWLNQINPWAGKGVPKLLKDIAFAVLVILILNFAFNSFFDWIGGAR